MKDPDAWWHFDGPVGGPELLKDSSPKTIFLHKKGSIDPLSDPSLQNGQCFFVRGVLFVIPSNYM